ncbi:MAG: hypothetical protein B0D92_03650 [Spirochaeta sp. LUC14_002_19_P3]|nr:MAG: hypothetical protein B0D92_03650 [Spirochaeta sp. LUC14_002_19_P3]
MKIEHIAIWTKELEVSRRFYAQFFGAKSGEKYENKIKGFSSYFLTFEDGCRLEIMNLKGKTEKEIDTQYRGIAHFAISAGKKEAVNHLTELLRGQGVPILSEPRETGDGYYESVVLDPDGNRIEITV